MKVIYALSFLTLYACTYYCCDINMPCEKCTELNCIFVISKDRRNLCVKDLGSIVKIRAVFEDFTGCKIVEEFQLRNGNLSPVKETGETQDKRISSPSAPISSPSSTSNVIVNMRNTTMLLFPVIDLPSFATTTSAGIERNLLDVTEEPYHVPIHNTLLGQTGKPDLVQTTKESHAPTVEPPTISTTPPVTIQSTTAVSIPKEIIPSFSIKTQFTPPVPNEFTTPSSTSFVVPPRTPERITTGASIKTNPPTIITTGIASILTETPTTKTTERTKPIQAVTYNSSAQFFTTAADRTLTLSNSMELFFMLPTRYECPEGKRNETLLVTYASSLCTIARLSAMYGISKFADTDQGWLLLNPARKANGMCTAIKLYRKKCRIHSRRKIRHSKVGLTRGQRSPRFQQVDSLWHCGNRTKEGLLNRLARIICYSGDVFLELKESTQLHNYDLAFGLITPSFRHAFKCSSLYYRKRRCHI